HDVAVGLVASEEEIGEPGSARQVTFRRTNDRYIAVGVHHQPLRSVVVRSAELLTPSDGASGRALLNEGIPAPGVDAKRVTIGVTHDVDRAVTIDGNCARGVAVFATELENDVTFGARHILA